MNLMNLKKEMTIDAAEKKEDPVLMMRKRDPAAAEKEARTVLKEEDPAVRK